MADIEYSKAKITDDKGNVLKEPKKDEASKGRFSWWKEKGDELARQVWATIKFLAHNNSAHMEQLTISTRMYGNTSAVSLMGSAFTRASAVSSSPAAQRISFNLCASVVDTLVSQIAKNKIVPTFITSGGKWGMQRKAENLSKFIDGCFYENKVHDKGVMCFRDGAVWGDGHLHVFRTADDRVGVERALPHEFLIDNVEAMVSGKSMQMHRVRIVDRDVLVEEMADVKGAEEKINRAMPANMQEVSGQGSAGDLVTIAESWRLPSGPNAKDGVHAITLDSGECLFEEEWKRDYFPFPTFQYSKRLLGAHGQGAVERLQNLQGEINRLMILIQKSMWMGGSFKVLVPVGSKVVSQHLNNEVGAIIHYAGDAPPQYITPPMIQQDIYPYVDALIEKGYRQEGVSMLGAANVKPIGVNSGTALRTYDKIADDRQLQTGQSMEAVYLEVARQMIDVVKDIFADKKSYKVTWPGVRFIDTIDWKDVNLQEDEYVLKAFPTSSLPDEPMAKLETIQEYMQAGLISPRAGRKLMRTEDIEMSDMLANAAEDLICKTIEDIIYDMKDDVRPDGNWDLQLAKQLSLEYYNFAMVNNCPEENLALLRTFQDYVSEEMGETQSAAVPMAGPGGASPNGPAGQPMAVPQPTPQSNMVPNVAGVQ
jgi:hypothetical protein